MGLSSPAHLQYPDLEEQSPNLFAYHKLRTMQQKDILVFGRTGAGKSTIANMLVTGRLTHTPVFPIGDGMEGVTGKCRRKEGRSYSVVDTVGLGEATGLHEGAKEQVRRYLKRNRGEFTHILFVRRGRHQADDDEIWKAFLELFKGAETAFVVCITGTSNENYLYENRRRLGTQYPECRGRFICVDFPPIDPELKHRQVAKRRRSLQHLENRLEEIFGENRKRSFRPDLCKEPPQLPPATPSRRQLNQTRMPTRISTLDQQRGLQQRPARNRHHVDHVEGVITHTSTLTVASSTTSIVYSSFAASVGGAMAYGTEIHVSVEAGDTTSSSDFSDYGSISSEEDSDYTYDDLEFLGF